MIDKDVLDRISTREECDSEIEKRRKLHSGMVGWLYSGMLEQEIVQLRIRRRELDIPTLTIDGQELP